ncbi:hypothetical protein GBAR_LOCUS18216 [Geodia barretti]|uniref:Uncharacterized protein n=1 Tax=Geodia barretti TaxID=519541 RepID=A0AA35SNU6_GEOBA|nr:hypothetical protein GBAR_LOCUS18216 [Geodia barretti]
MLQPAFSRVRAPLDFCCIFSCLFPYADSCHPGDFCHRFPDARCRFNKGRLGWWTPYGQEVIGLC